MMAENEGDSAFARSDQRMVQLAYSPRQWSLASRDLDTFKSLNGWMRRAAHLREGERVIELPRAWGTALGKLEAMSGIIGYVGHRPCREVLCAGLRRLDHQGYEGLAVVDHLGSGIGHTRWATHGAASERRANPHRGPSGRIRIALDGIVENHIAFHPRLVADSLRCSYETDAEAVAHLLALNYEGDLVDAVRCSLPDLDGRFAFVAMCEEEPDMLVGTRQECPLVLGVGEGEQFIASSVGAFLDYTHDVAVLGNDQIAVLRPDDVSVMDAVARPRRPDVSRVG